MFLNTVLSILFLFIGVNCESIKHREEMKLQKHLNNIFATNYSKYVVPSLEYDVVIYIGLSPTSLIELDSDHQIMRTSGYLTLEWADDLLTWNPADFGGIDETVVNIFQVWKPTLSLHNGVGDNQWLPSRPLNGDTLIRLYRMDNKTYLRWYIKEEFVTKCHISIKSFPSDEQQCKIQIISMDGVLNPHRGRFIFDTIQTIEDSLLMFTDHSDWRKLGASQNITRVFGRSAYSYKFKFLRNATFYIFNLVLPLIFLSVITVLVHLLPICHIVRVNICVTVFLSYTVFMLILHQMLPKSIYIPDLTKYLVASMSSTFFTLVSAACGLFIYGLNPEKRPPRVLCKFLFLVDSFVQHLCSCILSTCCRRGTETNNPKSESMMLKSVASCHDGETPRHLGTDAELGVSPVNYWVLLAKTINQFTFLVTFISTAVCAILFLFPSVARHSYNVKQ